jgi:hypothetical protein
MRAYLIAEAVNYYTPMCLEYIKRGDAKEAGWYAKMAASYTRLGQSAA